MHTPRQKSEQPDMADAFQLDPKQTALVLIDLQKGILGRQPAPHSPAVRRYFPMCLVYASDFIRPSISDALLGFTLIIQPAP